MLRTAIALSLTFALVPAHAEIFKCVDSAGKVEYRNSVCPSGAQSAALDIPVAQGPTLEIRRSADDREVRREPGIERPASTPRVPPAEPVNALPPPPAQKEK